MGIVSSLVFKATLRMLIAALCGFVIGYERDNRMKDAGVRTHLIVALGSALAMVISKYGFNDMFGIGNMHIDASRIASQVVCGIGFLGSGMIIMNKHSVNGLTTAAGVWATAVIGLAVGCGLYAEGIVATALIICAQVFLHAQFNWLALPKTVRISMKIADSKQAIDYVKAYLKSQNIGILNFKIRKNRDMADMLEVALFTELPAKYNADQLLEIVDDNELVKYVEF